MSAELQGVSLRLILEKLKREKGIWFEGDESVLDETISIWFNDLLLEEGLRRILSGINHVLLFDREKGLVGLFIFGKKESRGAVPRDEPPAIEKGFPSGPVEDATVSEHPFETSPPPFRLAAPKTKSTGTTRGGDSPFSQDPHTEIADGHLMDRFPSIGNPFTQKSSPSPENPFNENVSPLPENPFLNPFGASR